MVAAQAASDLHTVTGPPRIQETLPVIDRLECLREALAVLAIVLTGVHGRLAWFLGAASTSLAPVPQWRALSAENGFAFGAIVPDPEQYVEAEDAIRRLRTALTRITTT